MIVFPVGSPWCGVATAHVEGTTAASPWHPSAEVLQLRHHQRRKWSCEVYLHCEVTAAFWHEATRDAALGEVTGVAAPGEATGDAVHEVKILLWASDFLATAFLRTLKKIEIDLWRRA